MAFHEVSRTTNQIVIADDTTEAEVIVVPFNGVETDYLIDPATKQMYEGDGNGGYTEFDFAGGGGGGSQTLAQTLAFGFVTGDNDIEVTNARTIKTNRISKGLGTTVIALEDLIVLPKYTDLQEPLLSIADGECYFNTTIGKVKICYSGTWRIVGSGLAEDGTVVGATGQAQEFTNGTVQNDLTATGNLTLSSPSGFQTTILGGQNGFLRLFDDGGYQLGGGALTGILSDETAGAIELTAPGGVTTSAGLTAATTIKTAANESWDLGGGNSGTGTPAPADSTIRVTIGAKNYDIAATYIP